MLEVLFINTATQILFHLFDSFRPFKYQTSPLFRSPLWTGHILYYKNKTWRNFCLKAGEPMAGDIEPSQNMDDDLDIVNDDTNQGKQ